jgi:alpha-tubulin suppressor-like RCC1 family protein
VLVFGLLFAAPAQATDFVSGRVGFSSASVRGGFRYAAGAAFPSRPTSSPTKQHSSGSRRRLWRWYHSGSGNKIGLRPELAVSRPGRRGLSLVRHDSLANGAAGSGGGEGTRRGARARARGCTWRCERPALASGRDQTCALRAGRVECWGEGASTPSEGSRAWYPAVVPELKDALQLATYGDHSCALRQGGRVSCWGNNSFGQLGDETRVPSSVPVEVTGITTAVQVAVGAGHSCALLRDGTVQCWGDNSFGQLGGGSSTNSAAPVTVSNLDQVRQIAASDQYSCGLLTDGSVHCWGEDFPTHVPVAGLEGVRSIAAGDTLACALCMDGALRCWQPPAFAVAFEYGELPANVTQLVVSGFDWMSQDVSVCALTSDGTIACSGANSHGQLGSGDRTDRRAFALVSGIHDAVEVSAGRFHACAHLATGKLRCWGGDEVGQLGIGFAHTNYPNGVAIPVEAGACL